MLLDMNVPPSGLCVRNLTKRWRGGPSGQRRAPVLDRISFQVSPGEIFGVMGPSGSGKTTLARILLRMIPADAGEVWLDGRNILTLRGKSLADFRRRVQAVTQQPETALNPRMTIRESLREVFRVLGARVFRETADEHLAEMLDAVMLAPEHLARYPSELSGGELQRVVIARVMALAPRLIIADEPTSNLDTINQARIIRLMCERSQRIGAGMILISHDEAMLGHVCHGIYRLNEP